MVPGIFTYQLWDEFHGRTVNSLGKFTGGMSRTCPSVTSVSLPGYAPLDDVDAPASAAPSMVLTKK